VTRRTKDETLRDGEPWLIALERMPGDTDAVLRGSGLHACCDCGMRHTITFEFRRVGQRKGELTLRFYVV